MSQMKTPLSMSAYCCGGYTDIPIWCTWNSETTPSVVKCFEKYIAAFPIIPCFDTAHALENIMEDKSTLILQMYTTGADGMVSQKAVTSSAMILSIIAENIRMLGSERLRLNAYDISIVTIFPWCLPFAPFSQEFYSFSHYVLDTDLFHIRTFLKTYRFTIHIVDQNWYQWPLLLTWFNFNPSMDK